MFAALRARWVSPVVVDVVITVVVFCATVYRLIQEALTNVVKHAGAEHVTVDLDWSPGALAVTVEDDGRGPGKAPANVNGAHGLIGMRERVDACGGELSTGPATGDHGFRVSARLPVIRGS